MQEIYHARRELQLLDRWLKDARPGKRLLISPDKRHYIALNEQSKVVFNCSGGLIGMPRTLQTTEDIAVMETWMKAQKHAPLAQWKKNI